MSISEVVNLLQYFNIKTSLFLLQVLLYIYHTK